MRDRVRLSLRRLGAATPTCGCAGATCDPILLTPSCRYIPYLQEGLNQTASPILPRLTPPPPLISYDHPSRLPLLTLGHINILSSPPVFFLPCTLSRARLPLSPTSPLHLNDGPPDTPTHKEQSCPPPARSSACWTRSRNTSPSRASLSTCARTTKSDEKRSEKTGTEKPTGRFRETRACTCTCTCACPFVVCSMLRATRCVFVGQRVGGLQCGRRVHCTGL